MAFENFFELPSSVKLANGVSAYFRKTQPSGLVSVQVWIKTGSIHEGECLGGGLSHYLEHMLFKGTEKYSAEEITRRVQAVGGSINAYTTFSRTVYYIDVPTESAEVAFEILAQLTQKPKLDSAEAAREKDVILREIDMGRDDPDSRLSEDTIAEAFRVHPIRIPVIGYKNVFSQMTDRELKQYFENRYTPANTSIVVAGDIDESVVFALAEKYFSEMRERPCVQPFIPSEPEQLSPREVTLHGEVKILRGNLLWKTPGVAHEDAPALSVLSALLGKGDSSLLWQELHERKELVHAVDVSAWMPNELGLFWVSYAADLGKRAEVEDAVLKVVSSVVEEGVAPELLKKVSRQALVGMVNSSSTAASAAARLGAECVERGDPAATKFFYEKIKALTPEDVRRVAEKYLVDTTRTTSAFEKTPPAKSAKVRASRAASPFPKFEATRLSCGIRVLTQPVPGFPKVHIRASALGGGAFESPSTRGATALMSSLLTLDAGARTASEVAEAIESVGGRFDETSGNNTFSLYTETLSGDEAVGCDILADALTAPKFSREAFLRERSTQLAALLSEYDEVEEYARIALREQFFGTHPMGTHNYGTEESLAALSLDDVCALRSRLVVPENLVIAVSGEFDRERLTAMLEEKFAGFGVGRKPAASPDISSVFEKMRPQAAREIEIAPPSPAEQAIVQLAFPDVGCCDERYWVGSLVDELLSGMSSRLFLEVREKRGLAYFVGAGRVLTPVTGMFYLYAGTEKAKTEVVLEEMRKELQRLREGKVTAEEIAGAKARICVGRRTARQRASVRCASAVLNALYGLPADRDEEMEARLGALTVDDIARFATEVLSPDAALALTIR